MGVIYLCQNSLLDYANLRAGFSFSGKFALFDLSKSQDTFFLGVDGKIAAHVCTVTGYFRSASLSDEYFASIDCLSARALNAKTRAGVVVVVLT